MTGLSIPEAIANAQRFPRVSLRFGPLTIRFQPARPEWHVVLLERLVPFRVPDSEPVDCDLECHFGEPAAFRDAPVEGQGEPWELRIRADGVEQMCSYAVRQDGIRELVEAVELGPELDRGKLVQRPMLEIPDGLLVSSPFDELVACRVLARMGALVLHACSVEVDGEALVFMGHSGAGKSTVAAICERMGAIVLSDDRTIVTMVEGRVVAHGTPWHGSYRRASPRAAVVAAVFLLEQAPETEATKLSDVEAYAETFVRLIQPTTVTRDIRAGADVLARVIERTPFGRLRFRPEEAALRTAEAFVRHAKQLDATAVVP